VQKTDLQKFSLKTSYNVRRYFNSEQAMGHSLTVTYDPLTHMRDP